MTEYRISHGTTSACILPEKGATVVGLSRDGVEFLYRDQENLDSPERPRCGIPFLFPIFGRLVDGAYSWNGQSYSMEIHGFAHTSVWTVAEHRPDALKLELVSDERILGMYPFPFRAELIFEVQEGRLTIRQRFENTGAESMPYNFGFHPYFFTEHLDRLVVETTAAQHFDFSVGKPVPFGHGCVSVSIPEGAPETGAAFMGVTGPTILHMPAEGRQVVIEHDENSPQLVLWTQAGKDFLCAEPINGTANGLNTGIYRLLAPGDSAEAVLNIHINLICQEVSL